MVRVTKPSKATRFNARILKKLQDAIASDPEVDLVTKLPTEYSTRLRSMRNSMKTDNNDRRLLMRLRQLRRFILSRG
ncbi:hypothetical protein ASPCAL06932 [Aspergillus calidoustus]|uniref:Uncharacterized protein n=1 Tax=Aspergillus calidoustus TaxID=454130 RepID=A0A0U5G222_ASPCI|nr:hypothetical protein ASPCAL06932 [Aspergillus calidoustus]